MKNNKFLIKIILITIINLISQFSLLYYSYFNVSNIQNMPWNQYKKIENGINYYLENYASKTVNIRYKYNEETENYIINNLKNYDVIIDQTDISKDIEYISIKKLDKEKTLCNANNIILKENSGYDNYDAYKTMLPYKTVKINDKNLISKMYNLKKGDFPSQINSESEFVEITLPLSYSKYFALNENIELIISRLNYYKYELDGKEVQTSKVMYGNIKATIVGFIEDCTFYGSKSFKWGFPNENILLMPNLDVFITTELGAKESRYPKIPDFQEKEIFATFENQIDIDELRALIGDRCVINYDYQALKNDLINLQTEYNYAKSQVILCYFLYFIYMIFYAFGLFGIYFECEKNKKNITIIILSFLFSSSLISLLFYKNNLMFLPTLITVMIILIIFSYLIIFRKKEKSDVTN